MRKYIPKSLDGQELVFYNYKEPLKPIVGGYGFHGVVLSNKEGTGIQCHICGEMFMNLSSHVMQAHEIKVRDYKEKYGLAHMTSLVSEQERQRLKMNTIKWLQGMTAKERRDFRDRRIARFKEWRNRKISRRQQPKLTLESKNKRGTCPDQLLAKIKEVAKHLGHSPSKDEFIDYFKSQKFLHIIYKTFGSWIKAKEMAGYSENKRYELNSKKYEYHTAENLLEYLKIFYQETGKPPTETDCKRGLIPESGVYRKFFGSFPEARLQAGITEKVGRWEGNKTK